MEDENLIFPKIPQSYLKQINEFEKKRKTLLDSNEEKYRLLYDGIIAFKKGLYFSSIPTMRIFIEKSLRDKLISLNLDKKLGKRATKKEYDKEEKTIEDGIIEGKNKGYAFKKICDDLYLSGVFKKEEHEGLKELYEIYRIPIQHGIYRRLIGYISKMSDIKSSIKTNTQYKGKLNSKEYRYITLPTTMLVLCSVTLGSIDDLIDIIEEQ